MYNFAEKLSFFIQEKRYKVTHTQRASFEDSKRVSIIEKHFDHNPAL